MEVTKKPREEIWENSIREKVYPSYKDLKLYDYFVGTIQISEFVQTYTINNKTINVYKTTENSYIPYIHTTVTLDVGKKYEISGYKHEKEAQIFIINEIE